MVLLRWTPRTAFKLQWNPHNVWFAVLTILSAHFRGVSCIARLCNHHHHPAAKELFLLNCAVEKNSWESFELQGDQTRSNLKEINPEYLLGGLMNIHQLKLQYFGYLMWGADSLENPLMLGKTKAGGEGGNRGWDGWTAFRTQWTWI